MTTLFAITAGPEGANPRAALFQASDGNLYGTTQNGGLYDHGTIFRMTPSGTTSTLYTFTGGQDGGYPIASLIQGADGNLYGLDFPERRLQRRHGLSSDHVGCAEDIALVCRR